MLPDFPATTKWLTPTERRLAQVRMAEEVAGSFDEGDPRGGLRLAIRDWKVWWLGISLFSMVLGLAAFQNFFPSTYSRTIGFFMALCVTDLLQL